MSSEPPAELPPRVHLTVDVVLEQGGAILLVRRGSEPFQGRWALPGGFVEADEDLPDAAIRELAEETGVDLARAGIDLAQLGAYGRPGRDPRGRTVSVVYLARSNRELGVTGSDDAAEARFFSLSELPPLAFDHAEVVADAVALLCGSVSGDAVGVPVVSLPEQVGEGDANQDH